ncbi:hypothetical protein [Streptomyces uncialis]|uniref:hypothetical protein n=1 Tax=Streptomyces uncialis TaxID=1048205 RepID=UPI00093DEA84|nr:hypothetical protein [Streptomyces uncialis]
MTAAKTPRKTAAAKKAEASVADASKPSTFDHRGITFEVPLPLDLPVGLLECEDEFEAIRLILGKEQWAAYKATGATIRDFQELATKVGEAQGFGDSGN